MPATLFSDGATKELVLILVVVDHRHHGPDLNESRVLDLADFRRLEEVGELANPGFHHALLVLRRVVLGVLLEIAVFACLGDPCRDLDTADRRQLFEFGLELLVGGRREPGRRIGHRVQERVERTRWVRRDLRRAAVFAWSTPFDAAMSMRF